VFLQLNGVDSTSASNDEVYEFVMEAASGQQSVAEIAEGLRRIIR
jgi:prophage maintenance system killer protein